MLIVVELSVEKIFLSELIDFSNLTWAVDVVVVDVVDVFPGNDDSSQDLSDGGR